MKKIKLGVTGYAGRMGKAVIEEAVKFPQFITSCALTEQATSSNNNFLVTDDLKTLCKESDVIIDFSSHTLLAPLAKAAVTHHTPLVCGTTGLTPSDFKELEKASKKIPVLYSQNMSVGINTLCSLLRSMYLKLEDQADIDICETHHKHKKDKPSGTAILLAEHMLATKNIEAKIKISSIREGNVPGQHDINFMMKDEKITISHEALSRNIFAIGALKAAAWLHGKRPGLYSMEDMFN